jgi:hypothetical protein
MRIIDVGNIAGLSAPRIQLGYLASPCEIYGGKVALGQVFTHVLWFTLSVSSHKYSVNIPSAIIDDT